MKASYVSVINKESHVDIMAVGQGPRLGTYLLCEQVMSGLHIGLYDLSIPDSIPT